MYSIGVHRHRKAGKPNTADNRGIPTPKAMESSQPMPGQQAMPVLAYQQPVHQGQQDGFVQQQPMH